MNDRVPVLRGRWLTESYADGRQGGSGVAAVDDRAVAVAVDVPRLVVPSTDLVPRRHHEALEIAAPLLDPPPVFTEVVEHDLEHVHR